MPAGGFSGGARGGNRNKESKSKTLDKNAVRKQEAQANKQPSAHAAKIHAKKALAKEKAKARNVETAGMAGTRGEHAASKAKKAARFAGVESAAKNEKLSWTEEDGNLSISGKL